MPHGVQHGPTPVSATIVGGRTIIEMSSAEGLCTSDARPVRGLETADAVGSFVAVPEDKIAIEGNKIIIDRQAARVRYAWQPYTTANLVNGEGLPTSTFEIKVTNE